MAANISNASLVDIYGQLNDAPTYHPMDAETFSDWSLEAGDIVTFKRQGEADKVSPIYSTKLVWRGAPQMTVSSTGSKSRDPISKVSRQKYGRGSGAMRSSQEIHNAVYSEDGILYSLVEQTATSIRTEVGIAISNMAHSVIEQTATYIRTEVANAASSISASVIEQTSEYVRTEVQSIASGVAWAVVTQTMTGIVQEVGRRARVYVQWTDPADDHDMMDGDLWYKKRVNRTWDEIGQETWDALSSYKWQDLYGIKHFVWKNGQWVQVLDTAAIVESEVNIEHDDEHWAVLARQVDIMGEQYSSNLTVTAQKISSNVDQAKADLHSDIEQTATQIRTSVYEAKSQIYSSITQTSREIRAEVADVAEGLETTIMVTATGVYSQVSDYVNDNFSTILQTSTSIVLAVASARTDWKSEIKVERDRIGLVVSGTGADAKVHTANIVAGINAQTGSYTTIAADKINLEGYVQATSLNTDWLKALVANVSGNITIGGNVYAGLNGSSYFQGTTYKIVGPSSSQGARLLSLNYSNMSTAIKSASVSGNTLTLTQFDDTLVTFSKATSLSGAWSSGTFTVTASPQGNTLSSYIDSVLSNGALSYNSTTNLVTAPIKVMVKIGSGSQEASGYTQDFKITGPTDISFWDANNNRWTGTHEISAGVTLTAYCKMAGSWVKGDEVRINPASRTDKGSNWYCTVTNNPNGTKSCSLAKTFSASQTVPFSNDQSYHLYT